MRGLLRLTGAACILALGLPAAAQDRAWDQDGDGIIMEDEFSRDWRERDMFGSFDADRDGALSEEEFETGVFGRYDRDADGLLGDSELLDAENDFGGGGVWSD